MTNSSRSINYSSETVAADVTRPPGLTAPAAVVRVVASLDSSVVDWWCDYCDCYPGRCCPHESYQVALQD